MDESINIVELVFVWAGIIIGAPIIFAIAFAPEILFFLCGILILLCFNVSSHYKDTIGMFLWGSILVVILLFYFASKKRDLGDVENKFGYMQSWRSRYDMSRLEFFNEIYGFLKPLLFEEVVVAYKIDRERKHLAQYPSFSPVNISVLIKHKRPRGDLLFWYAAKELTTSKCVVGYLMKYVGKGYTAYGCNQIVLAKNEESEYYKLELSSNLGKNYNGAILAVFTGNKKVLYAHADSNYEYDIFTD